MHDNYDLRQEQMNKSSLVSSRKFLGTLLDIFTTHVVSAMHFSSVSPFLCIYAPKGLCMRMLWISTSCQSVKLLPCLCYHATSIPYFPFYSSLSSFLGVDPLSLAIRSPLHGDSGHFWWQHSEHMPSHPSDSAWTFITKLWFNIEFCPR